MGVKSMLPLLFAKNLRVKPVKRPRNFQHEAKTCMFGTKDASVLETNFSFAFISILL